MLLLAAAAAVAAPAPASLESLARAHRRKPTAATRAALARFAAAHPKDAQGALALVVAGIVQLEQGGAAQAVRDLRAAAPRLAVVADHVALPLASALYQTKEYDAALRALDAVWKSAAVSPLRGRAAMVAARAWLEKEQPAEAVRVLEANAADLPQPQAGALLARALEAKGDLAAAAGACQRVYCEYPASPEAAEAGRALERLRAALGAQYPPETPQAMLARTEKLAAARDYRQARQELESLAGLLTGAERDTARVRLGVVDYQRGETASAYRSLRALEVSTPEAGAERLYYLVACARRLNNDEAMAAHQAELARRYPHSRWRLEALVAEGNHHLLDNRVASFVPLYRACCESFPDQARAPYCHWKVAWSEYLARGAGAATLLREHLARYPASEKAGAALYYLARLAEEAGDPAAAKTYYHEIPARWPNSYYGMLAREKLKAAPLARAALAPGVREWLARIAFPARETRPDFEPAPATRRRIERARLLASAALDDWAATELRFEGRNGGQAHIAALELARLAARRGAHDQAVRTIKSLASGYLFMPLDAAPEEFWKLAFPIPYRAEIEKYCRERSLDPFLVAALIRQESEFDPKAVSRARAYGLMQVLPSTGRQLARRAGLNRFSAPALFRPEVNLNLGTRIFRSLADQYGGRLEPALAAYNAGKSRADAWLNWGSVREPSEFVEAIPFTETRDYVQIVLRNADLYRRLYGR
ncbi:MAG: transglycosylase SLT domain-containing protein [Acidobacteria bacterium]|nr:transglycosylase SLT domain-containing protein [Acidobacteriota bacterium]